MLGATLGKENKKPVDAATKSKAALFLKEFTKQGNALTDRYYGNFIRAAKTEHPKAWEYAITELAALRAEAQPTLIKDVTDMSGFIYNTLVGNTEEYNSQFAGKILKALLAAAIPDFKKAVDAYSAVMNDLRSLRQLAETKARSL